ncbi:uncharacterized protein A4U43_C04F5050 [Asparagus officinalis]|uniref:Uncharacterized protein n=1 Tax=Asparagus officinalis TaxID=4686 RepID=A0A5P1F075_ASPOF|nr:uncharacterized protein A4U43_C04F5050 [Asparagus officinalis]
MIPPYVHAYLKLDDWEIAFELKDANIDDDDDEELHMLESFDSDTKASRMTHLPATVWLAAIQKVDEVGSGRFLDPMSLVKLVVLLTGDADAMAEEIGDNCGKIAVLLLLAVAMFELPFGKEVAHIVTPWQTSPDLGLGHRRT